MTYLKLARTTILTLCASIALCPATRASDLDTARDLHREGLYDRALSAYRVPVGDENQPAADRATAANNACVILLDTGLYPSALAACETARTMRLELGDTPRLARTLNNLAAVLEASGQYERAMESYVEALAINQQLEDWESVAINYGNLGVLATQTGELGSALSYYDRVEALATLHSSEPWAPIQIRFANINRSVVLEKIGIQ